MFCYVGYVLAKTELWQQQQKKQKLLILMQPFSKGILPLFLRNIEYC